MTVYPNQYFHSWVTSVSWTWRQLFPSKHRLRSNYRAPQPRQELSELLRHDNLRSHPGDTVTKTHPNCIWCSISRIQFPLRETRNILCFETEIYVGWDCGSIYVAVVCLPSSSNEWRQLKDAVRSGHSHVSGNGEVTWDVLVTSQLHCLLCRLYEAAPKGR